MAQEGWFPLLCVGLRSQWENVHLQDLQDSYGQEWVSIDATFRLLSDCGHGITLPVCALHCLQTFSQRLYQEYTCYTVFFVSIEICQISDVLIRKTRRLSVFQQGFFRSVKRPITNRNQYFLLIINSVCHVNNNTSRAEWEEQENLPLPNLNCYSVTFV